MAKLMLFYLSVLAAASCMLQLSLCQECSELDVGNDGEPESGQHRVHDAKFSSCEAGDKINDCVN